MLIDLTAGTEQVSGCRVAQASSEKTGDAVVYLARAVTMCCVKG